MKKIIVLTFILALISGALWYLADNGNNREKAKDEQGEIPKENVKIDSFEKCVEKGYPVLESYPPQCKTPDGTTFVQNVGSEMEKADKIRITSPRPNEKISSPVKIIGEARGTWYFEATFPIVLVDWDGRIIAEGYAQAQGDWMTENFVPFESMLQFKIPDYGEAGTLILKKSNPSGLPENDDSLEIPVKFK